MQLGTLVELQRLGSSLELLHAGVILGSQHFLDEVQEKIKAKSDQIEIPRMQRHVSRESLEESFKTEALETTERDALIYKAYMRNGYTMKEIADYLGLHYATVSLAIKRMEKRKK